MAKLDEAEDPSSSCRAAGGRRNGEEIEFHARRRRVCGSHVLKFASTRTLMVF